MATIYFNGIPLGEAPELTLTTDSHIDEGPTRVIIPHRSGEATLTFQAQYNKSSYCLYYLGSKSRTTG